MAYSSADISGMIGGQTAMFSNYSAYSMQVGGMVGTGPMMGGGGMPMPQQPHMGSKMAGAAAMGMGGAATGISVAGGLMGGAAGWADPFTAGARGFSAGSGGMSAIGSAFAQGGARAGIGAIGGGIGGAALAAAPAVAAGMAISHAGSQMYQGVQNLEDVRSMSGHFGSQMGQAGSTMGGGMGTGTIKKITGALHELVGEDMRTTMEELKVVMDNAGRMGMLTGITDANTFKQKFGGIVKQVRQVADIMGSTLAEAAPMMGQLNKMGMWTGADVMGTAVAGRASGAAPQMMQTMGQGAAISHAMGGTMRAGAMMGRESFMNISAGVQSGALTNRDIMGYTGGVGGAEGQRMVASSMQGIMSRFGQTSAGRLMMAGLGQRGEGGEFTGGIDKGKLEDFLGGGTSIQDLQKQGRKQLSGPNAASFMDVEGELAQNLGAEGGIGAMSKITEQVMGKMGADPKLRQQLMRQMLGVSNREAKMLTKLMDEMPRIRDQQSRQTEDAINKAFEQLEQKQHRSWDALKTAATHSLTEGINRPLQEAGEQLAADFGEAWDSASDALTGRTRRISMGTKERQRLIRGGALTADYSSLGLGDAGQSFVSGSAVENLTRGIQSEGLGEIGIGAALGGLMLPGIGTAVGAAFGARATGLTDGGTQKQAALRRLGIGTEGGEGALDLGGGFRASRADVRRGMMRGSMRAGGAGRKAMGFDKKGAQVEDFKAGLKRLIGQKSGELRRLKEDDPKGYAEKLLREMGKEPTEENLDLLSLAQQEEDLSGGELAVDFKAMAADAGHMPTSPKELAEFQQDKLDELTSAVSGYGIQNLDAAEKAKEAFFKGDFGEALTQGYEAAKNIGIDKTDLEATLTGDTAGILQQYMGGTLDKKEAIYQLEQMGGKGTTARRLIETGRADTAEFKEAAGDFMKARGMQAAQGTMEKIRDVAVKGPGDIALRGPAAGEREKAFSSLVEKYRGGEDRQLIGEELMVAQNEAQSLASSLTRDQAKEFAKSGAIGRQVASLYEMSELSKGGALDEKQTNQMLQKLKGMGYDLEAIGGEGVQAALKDKKISKEEAADFGKKAAEAIKTQLSETTEARKTHNQKMMEQLNIFADANTKFVNAVNLTIGEEIKDKTSTEVADTPMTPEADRS